MVCNDNCTYFSDGERPYCTISGLAVSEGMRCIENSYSRDFDDERFEDDYDDYDYDDE